MSDQSLPTSLLVESHIAQCQSACIPVYVINKGSYSDSSIIIKINGLGNGCLILTQARDINGKLGWINPIGKEDVAESDIDAYIRRSIDRDPDIWAIEIEDPKLNNPFEGDTIG